MKKIYLFIVFILLSFSLSAQLLVKEEAVKLETSTGNIYGTLKVADSKKQIPIAVIIAGSGPTDRDGNQPGMKSNSLKMLSDGLYYDNIATLCFDKRLIAQSKAVNMSEADLRFEHYIDDIRQWIALLSKDKRFSDIIVVGHSEGSLIGMIACTDNPIVKKFVSIAGVGEPAGGILKGQLEKQLRGQPEQIKNTIFSYIDKLEQGQTISDVPPTLNQLFRPSVQPYMISWFKYNPQKEIAKLKIPVLIIQGNNDIQVSPKQAELLAKGNPKAEKLIIEKLNHVMKDSENMDMQEQIKNSYNNPSQPVNKDMINNIARFIKE